MVIQGILDIIQSGQKIVQNVTKTVKQKIANKKIKEEFTLKNATAYGGYNLFSDHVASGGLDRLLEQEFSGRKAAQAKYSLPVICRTIIDGYAMGISNLYQFEGIENDPLIAAKRGLDKLPDHTVLRKDLIKNFQSDDDVSRLRRVKGEMVRKELKKVKGNVVLEYDSTVETGYGFQEDLVVGYNPHKRGRASYHPQLCRERKTGLSVLSRLRPGDTASSTGFIDFLEESWRIIPERFKRIRRDGLCTVKKRMDSGYEYEEALRWMEEHGVGYVVKMAARGTIWAKVFNFSRTKYRKIETEVGEVEVASFLYQRNTWSKERRVVVIRWKEETNRAQTSLFDAMNYTYSIFVTNENWDEEDIYRFYDKRADVENHIREAKNDFSIGHISTGHFHANAADLELRLLAFNQMILFTTTILKRNAPRHFASTVRRKWLMIPAQLIKRGGRTILKLAAWWPFGDEWSLYRKNLSLA